MTNDNVINQGVLQTIERTLDFLVTDFGFVEVKRSGDRVLGALVIYENATTAVVISFERREQYAQVDLWHLVDGKGPRNARFDTSYEDANRIPLHQLMAVRSPGLTPWLAENKVGDDWFEPELRIYADFMREHAVDVLCGDFSVLEIVRQNQERTL